MLWSLKSWKFSFQLLENCEVVLTLSNPNKPSKDSKPTAQLYNHRQVGFSWVFLEVKKAESLFSQEAILINSSKVEVASECLWI